MAYYKTQIKNVGAGYAVDVHGKRLTFVGNYPCNAGDYVWTDGRFIFGHIANYPQPVIFDEVQSGIPVVGYTYNEAEDEWKELRGYFNSSGQFKKYNVAYNDSDSWIVNNSKIYKHEQGNFIDVEISESGEVLTAEYENNNSSAHFTPVTLDGENLRDAIIIVKKDNVVIQRVSLGSLVEKTNVPPDENWWAYFNFFKLEKDGNWTAAFSVEYTLYSEVQFDPNTYMEEASSGTPIINSDYIRYDLQPRQRITAKSFLQDQQKKGIDYSEFTGGKPLIDCLTPAQEEKTLGYYAVDPEDVGTHWGYVIEPTKECNILVTITVYPPDETKAVSYGGGSQVVTGGCEKKFIATSNGNIEAYSATSTKSRDIDYTVINEFVTDDPNNAVGHFYGGATSIEILGGDAYGDVVSFTFFNPDKYIGRSYSVKTATATFNGENFENVVKVPVQDGFQILSDASILYDSSDNPVLNLKNIDVDLPVFSQSMATSIGGNYFLGYRDGTLWRIHNGKAEQVAIGIKNYRLRKLKNISKSRR